MQKRSRIISLLALVLALVSCAPSVKESATVASQTTLKQIDAQNWPARREMYLPVKQIIPEPTIEPTPEVVSFPVTVTFYTANDPNQGTTDRTASGKPVSRGMVAVNRRMLEKYPFGTKVIIHGLGEAVIEDVGAGPDDWLDYYWPGTKAEALKMGIVKTTATVQERR